MKNHRFTYIVEQINENGTWPLFGEEGCIGKDKKILVESIKKLKADNKGYAGYKFVITKYVPNKRKTK